MKDNIYNILLDKYEEWLDIGRTYLYENIKMFTKKSPYMTTKEWVYTRDDIYSELFLMLDKICSSNKDRANKCTSLWYRCHRTAGSLNKIINVNSDIHSDEILSILPGEWIEEPDWMFEYVLKLNKVLNDKQLKILDLLKKWYTYTYICKHMKLGFYQAKRLAERAKELVKEFLDSMETQC